MGNGHSSGWHQPGPPLPRRRTLLAIALGFAIMQGGSGCQRLPLRAFDGIPEDNTRTTTKVEPGGEVVPGGLPELPSASMQEHPAGSDTNSPKEDEAPDRATPLLDAALSRAALIEPAPSEADKSQSAPKSAEHDGDPIELPNLSTKPNVPVPAPAPSVEPAAPLPLPEIATEPKTAAQDPPKINPDKPASERPREPWRDGLGELRAVARLRAGQPGEEAAQWRIRSFILDRFADAPGEGQPPANWSRVLEALAMAAGPETPDASLLGPKILDAVEALESLAPLAIVDLQLCRKIIAFGSREPLDVSALHAGQAVLVYCEMTGLSYEPGDDAFHSSLSASAEIVPAAGGAPIWSESLGTADDSCRQRRRDYYVNYRLLLPASLEPGRYQLRVNQKDAQSGQSAAATVEFAIVP
jgi:hypothetical protein